MILDTTARSLQIVLGEAKATSDCDIVACWAASSASVFTPTTAQTASNGVTPVTVVTAPALGVQTQVSEVRLHNNDTVPHQVTLRLLDGATTRIILTQTVAAGGDFLYAPTATSTQTPSGKVALTLGWGGAQAVTAGTYVFVGTAAYPFQITSLDASVGSGGGSITANVRNAASSVGLLSAAAISLAAKTSFPAAGANLIVLAGATVDVVLTITGAPVAAYLTLNGVRI